MHQFSSSRLIKVLKDFLTRILLESYVSHWLTVGSLVCIILVSAYWYRLADYDLFARVAAGRLILRDGAVPLTDPFAYSVTKSIWIDHEWLSGVIFYLTSQAGGDLALFALNLAAALLTISFLVRAQSQRQSEGKIRYAILFLSIFPSLFIWTSIVRAQVFTYAFFAYTLFVISRVRIRYSRSLLGTLPVLISVWANLHGGFVVGLGILGLTSLAWIIVRHPKRWVMSAILGISLLATLINPYGLQYLVFVAHAVFKPRPEITEWAATNPAIENLIFFSALAMSAGCFFTRARKFVPLEGWFILVVSAIFGVMHQRNVPFYLFSMCVFLPSALEVCADRVTTRWRERLRASYAAILTLTALGVILALGALVKLAVNPTTFKLDYDPYPVEALDWLKAHSLGGKLMVHFNQGSYALMKGYPRFQVSMDGRYEEVYPDSTFEQSLAAFEPSNPTFRDSFEALRPDYVILCRSLVPFEVASSFPGHWEHIYTDQRNECAVFANKSDVSTTVPTVKEGEIKPFWILDF